MQTYKIQIIETIIVLVGYILIHFITKTIINNVLNEKYYMKDLSIFIF